MESSNISPIKTGATCAIMALIMALSYSVAPESSSVVWYSVIPPVLAVSLVVVTQRLILGMMVGVVTGGLLAAHFHGFPVLNGVTRVGGYFATSLSDSWNLQILLFIPFMMCMVAVMIASGGIQAVVERLMLLSSGRRSAQITTILAGLLLFFDDYANTMVVGSGMRPITDGKRISRAKLAFLVDATSAPIAGLAMISTWVGYEIGLFNGVSENLSLGQDGFGMFLDALGFRYYCIMMVVFVFVNAISGRDFGPMLRAEVKSLDPANKVAVNTMKEAKPYQYAQRRLKSCFIPLGALFLVLLGGMWLDGGGAELFAKDPLSLLSPTAWQNTMIRVENSVTVLVLAAIVGFVLSLITAVLVGQVPLQAIGAAILTTLKNSCVPPITILVMAWVLKGVCDDLATGSFLVTTVGSSVSAHIFPAIVFGLAAVTAFSTGTSWGTMAILIPTIIPVAYQLDGATYGISTMICLGAVLDGSIFGDHCSPISDTTIMSSASSSCDLMEHVKTQMPYAVLVAILAVLCGYIPATLGLPTWASVLGASLLIIGIFRLFGRDPEKEGNPSMVAQPVESVLNG